MHEARVREAWAELLTRAPWSWYCTLTFRVMPSRGVRLQIQRWLGRLGKLPRTPELFCFWAEEVGRENGRLHAHALLGGAEALSLMDVTQAWVCGWANVRRYNVRLGAASYVTKYVVKDATDYDLYFKRIRLWTFQDFSSSGSAASTVD